MLLGRTVLAGWYTHTVAPLRVCPDFVAMAYNMALGFALCGGGCWPRQTRLFTQGRSVHAGQLGRRRLTKNLTEQPPKYLVIGSACEAGNDCHCNKPVTEKIFGE